MAVIAHIAVIKTKSQIGPTHGAMLANHVLSVAYRLADTKANTVHYVVPIGQVGVKTAKEIQINTEHVADGEMRKSENDVVWKNLNFVVRARLSKNVLFAMRHLIHLRIKED
jgi:hypothetical protein